MHDAEPSPLRLQRACAVGTVLARVHEHKEEMGTFQDVWDNMVEVAFRLDQNHSRQELLDAQAVSVFHPDQLLSVVVGRRDRGNIQL